MADTPNKSFLMDLDFNDEGNQPLVSNPTVDFLKDPSAQEVFAVAADRGNNLATDDLGRDLLELNYGQIAAKYGKEVADSRHNIQGGITENQRIRSTSRDLITGGVDAALDVTSGLVNTVGSLGSLALSGSSELSKLNDPTSGTTQANAATALSGFTEDVSGYLSGLKSDEFQDRNRLQSIESQLDAIDRNVQFGRPEDDNIKTSLKRTGKEILDAGGRILNDSVITQSYVAQGIGSLGPSAKIASTASKLLGKAATKITKNTSVIKAAETLGASAGVGVSEASGTYTQTVNTVMAMTHDNLVETSDIYRGFLDQGMSPEDAKSRLANDTGLEAFKRQLPIAATIGLISSKFESAPIRSFKGSGLIAGLKQIGSQTLEEGLQGGTGQLSQNIALRDNVDKNQSLTEGVGENIATGAIAGTGMAGVLATPSAIAGTGRLAIKGIKAVASSPKTADILAAAGSKIGDGLDVTSRAATKVKDTVAPYVAPVVDKVKPVVEAVVKPIIDKVEDINLESNKSVQTGVLATLHTAEVFSKNIVDSDSTTPTVINELSVDTDPFPAPSVFKDNVAQGSSLISTVSGILKTVAKSNVKIHRLSNDSILYAASKLTQLKSLTNDLPSQVKKEISKVISSQDVKKILDIAKKIDLNETHSKSTKISKESVSEAVSVARINPANVNSDFVNKILEHSDREDITGQDIKYLKSAAKIAKLVDNHGEQLIEISKDMRVALSIKPAYQANPSKLPEILTGDEVSRSIQVSGYTDGRGNKLRSSSQYAADIFAASQTKDNVFINEDGLPEQATKLAEQFGKFVTHMNNKVEALNTSYDNFKEGNPNKLVGFTSLVGANTLIESGKSGSAKPVSYNPDKPGAVQNAQKVHNDAVITAEIYNTLIDTFPKLFKDIDKVTVHELRGQGNEIVEETQDKDDVDGSIPETNDQETATVTDEDVSTETESEDSSEPVEDTTPTEEEEEEVEEVDETVSFIKSKTNEHLPKLFSDSYIPKDDEVNYNNGSDVLDLVRVQEDHSAEYMAFADTILQPLMEGANKRLKDVVHSKKSKQTVFDFITSGGVLTQIRDYKNTAMVDQTTGEYDPDLLSLASVAVIDWLTMTRSSDPSRIKESLEDLGLTFSDVTEQEFTDIMFGVRPHQAAETIAKQVLKLWNVNTNVDMGMVDGRGPVEGLVKELLTVLEDVKYKGENVIEINTIPSKVEGKIVSTQTINIKPMQEIQKEIGTFAQGSVQNLLAPEDITMPSIGTKITNSSSTQERGTIPLSNLEIRARDTMQDTAYYKSEGVAGFMEALDFVQLAKILGHQEFDHLSEGHPLRLSIQGKNMAIERDYNDAIDVVKAIDSKESEDQVPVYFPVGISKVGRHQMKGINAQNNKILRMMVTPTHSTLDMTNQEDTDNFWLTVAQSSGLFKVENVAHSTILDTVQNDFETKYLEPINVAKQWVATGNLDSTLFAESLGEADTALISSIIAVAQLHHYKENNTSPTEFNTTLSFELDGKTDGPGNMMSNFGQGLISPQDFNNFKRVGYFLGRKDTTLNDYFGIGNKDLYNTMSRLGVINLYKSIPKSKNKRAYTASLRFSSLFGDLEVDNQGNFSMDRNTSKGPMTKTVYGSSAFGIAQGMSQDMLIEFYRKMITVPKGTDPAVFLGYPTLAEDFKILFNDDLPIDGDWGDLHFDKKSIENFQMIITTGIGQLLSETAKQTIGDPITGVTDLLVHITGIQTEFLSRLFDKRLLELAEKRASEGKIGRNKQGKGIVRELSQRDYDTLVNELRLYAPLYSNGSQTLAVGSFSNQQSNIEMSSNMSGDLRQKSTMSSPELAGVKAIPYIVQGRGDAMMMNNIFGSDDAPTDVIPIFDGIDISVNKFKEYSERINRAVLKNWDTDVLVDVVEDFESFLRHAGSDSELLQEAFDTVKAESKINASGTLPGLLLDLKELHRQNKARKQVFKNIPLSVDHMGGADVPYTRGEGDTLTREEINFKIKEELTKTDETKPETISNEYTELFVTDGDVMVKSLLRELKDSSLRQTVLAIKDKLPEGLKIVTGSLEQLNTYRNDSFGDDGQVLKASGNLDLDNNTIFLAKDGHETLVHELVHAATYNQVLNHYQGNIDPSVTRLETLMGEFMGLDFSNSNEQTRTSVNAARKQIIERQASNDPLDQAAALNEFMAWSLSNEQLIKTLKTTRTSLFATLSKKVLHLLRRLMGGIPTDIFSHILFNTKILNRAVPADIRDEDVEFTGSNDGGDGSDNSEGEVTPPAHNFTGYWIDLVKEAIEAARTSNTPLSEVKKLTKYKDVAEDVLRQLDFGGFNLNEYQRTTFKAIHVVLATEMKLDTNSLAAMHNVFEYVTDNLSPEMFGKNGSQRYGTVMDLFGSTKNDEGTSDSIAVLLALSQTSKGFRNALDQLPTPETNKINHGSLNDFLNTSVGVLMRKVVGTISLSDDSTKNILDNLSEQLIRQDSDKEFTILRGLMDNINKADRYLGGALSTLAEKTDEFNEEIKVSDRSTLTKLVSNSVTVMTSFLDENRSKNTMQIVKNVTHGGTLLDGIVPVREFVSEIVGTDKINSKTVSLLDRTDRAISSVRQAYREQLPVILQDAFETHPDETQWKSMHKVLGKNDFAVLFKLNNPGRSMRLISEPSYLSRKITEAQNVITSNFKSTVAQDILEKAQQYADFTNGNGGGHQLITNAYALNQLAGEYQANMTKEIDTLMSLYTLKGSDKDQKQQVADLYKQDPEGVKNLVVYLQGLNKEEDLKIITEAAKMNGYKGYIPDQSTDNNSNLIISDDANKADLIKKGYTRMGDYTAEAEFSTVTRGYYFTGVKQGGAYSQGVMQNVHSSYRGVDSTTGLSVNGLTSGVITGNSADYITDQMNKIQSVNDNKETLLPRYNDNKEVIFYERMINPDLMTDMVPRRSNLALMLGSWAGRQIEEKFAQQYNHELVDQLKSIYDKSEVSEKGLFVNLADKNIKDSVFKDSWNVIPQETKEYIESIFGEETFFIRKDMVNLSVGYRDPSILDVWSGKTRLPKPMQDAVRALATSIAGDKAMSLLSRTEEITQGTISAAKDIIVVRSLVVPYMNSQANVFQLATRGVGTKDMIKGARDKLAEIEIFNDNEKKLIELQTRSFLNANDKNKVAIIASQIQTIRDHNKRMTIAPLIEAGAYKNISEGITDLDIQLTSGRMGEWIENQLNRLPSGVQVVAKYGLLSKDTALYKGANKAVQYGDFIAKSILYDHYVIRENMDPVIALERINEEFVNFSVLPGRTRSYMESLGGTWFLTFKIRIMKTALGVMRENPLKSLILANTVGEFGSPQSDNLLAVTVDDRLDYSLGWDMLFGSTGLNPWLNLSDWAINE